MSELSDPRMQVVIDLLTDELGGLERGTYEDFHGVEVHRSEKPDPDGWEYSIGSAGYRPADEVAKWIIAVTHRERETSGVGWPE